MKQSNKCNFRLATITCLFLLTGCAHDNFISSGIVADRHRSPLEGVAITVGAYDGIPVYTDSLGHFSTDVFEGGFRLNGKAKIHFEKKGYRSGYKTVRKGDQNRIRLRKKWFRNQ